jgi:hypothetical protein
MKKLLLLLLITFLASSSIHAQVWNQIIKEAASDRAADDKYGWSVAIHNNYAVVGAPYEDEDDAGINTKTDAGSAYILENVAGVWTQIQKIVASDRQPSDMFGSSVSISGDYIFVGAFTEDEDAAGANTLSAAGSAYVFHFNGTKWVQTQKLVAPDRDTDDSFGFSVSVSSNFAIISARNEDYDISNANPLANAGAAYIFSNVGGNWIFLQKVVAPDRAAMDYFGYSVAMDGNYAVVGAGNSGLDLTGANPLTDAGAAYVYRNNAGTWIYVQKIVAADRAGGANFGLSVAISSDLLIVGAISENRDATGSNLMISAGAAYIFNNVGGIWSQTQKIVAPDRAASDNFGSAVAISGNYALIGAMDEDEDMGGANTMTDAGSAYMFKNISGLWVVQKKLAALDRAPSDFFSYSVAMNNDFAIVGALASDNDAGGANPLNDAGGAYIYNSNEKIKGGVYTIGGINPKFSSINAAVLNLNSNGIDGVVTFKIRPGVYNEQFTINNFAKYTPADSVVFVSETGNNDVVIHHTATSGANNYILTLNSSFGVTFKNVTFNSMGSNLYYTCVKSLTGTSSINFANVRFLADKSATTGGLFEVNNAVYKLNIANCYFDGGANAILVTGGTLSSMINIFGNVFRNQSANVINLDMCKDLNISKNDIECSFGYGLMLNQGGASSIINNKINSLAGGIQLSNVFNTFSKPIKIINNRISVAKTGLNISTSGDMLVYHNSIISTSSNTADAAVNLSYIDSVEFKNNLVINTAGNVMLFNTGSYLYLKINNNRYIANVTTFSSIPNAPSLSSWNSITGFDAQSTSTGVLPMFVNNDASMLKLIPGNNFTQLKSTLDLLNTVPKDFEGQPRTSTPFYGADEFIYAGVPQSYLRGVITFGGDTLRAGRIILYADSSNNHRFDMIASAVINHNGLYEINNFTRRNYILKVLPDSLQYPSLIPTYFGKKFEWDSAAVFMPDSNVFTIKNVDMIQMTAITAATAKISGYVYQDGSLKTNDPIPGLDIILDKIPPSTSVKMTKTDANGYYEFTGLSSGDYVVKMDIAGIGKDSLYSLTLAADDTIIGDMNYCVDSTINTCKTDLAVKAIQKKNESLSIYPNPFDAYVKVFLPDENAMYTFQVYDLLGNQVLAKSSVSAGVLELNTATVPSGIYFMKVLSDKGLISESKLIKK